jgi:hypothetical protein
VRPPSPQVSSALEEVSTQSNHGEDIADAGVEKRDLAGFNAALNFATGALTTSPGVELGTGEGGSGVGITVKPGGAIAKREDGSLPAVTLLKIRSLGDQSGAEAAS